MSIAGNTLDLIRSVFRRDHVTAGSVPLVRYQSGQSGYGFGGSDVMGPAGSELNKHINDSVRLDQDLMSRYADYESMDEYPELGCFTGDTIVRTLDGPVRIDELSRKYQPGEIFKIYAYDLKNKEFVIADAHSARKTKTDKVIELVWDSGDVLKCTKDHKIMTRSGEYVEAHNLKIGQSVMPLETKVNSKGYMRILHPERPLNSRWEYVYNLVARCKFGSYEKGMSIHHIDEDKLNDKWDNLQLLTKAEHFRLHQPQWTDTSANLEWTEERRKKHAERLKGNSFAKGVIWAEEARKRITGRIFKQRKNPVELSAMLFEVRNSYSLAEAARKLNLDATTMNRRLVRYGVNYKDEVGQQLQNHKLVSVRELPAEDVYDLTTEKYHNFVANGVVVHNSALDLYADDATQFDVTSGKSIWVEAEDATIERVLTETFEKNLRVEEDLWEVARNMCKYGNDFEEIVVMDGVGVTNLVNVPTPTIRRIEDNTGILHGFVYDPRMSFDVDTKKFLDLMKQREAEISSMRNQQVMCAFEPWEMVHFRLRGKNRSDLYGASILEPARWVWKRLSMLEDAMLMYKLTRSPQRFVFYVDVGDVPPNEARSQVNKVKNEFKKQKFVDPGTGKIRETYNPLTQDEDIFVPVRKGKKSTEIEVLSGPEGQQVDDAEYFRDKLFAALKIPKSYLGSDETVGRANLAQQDVRFARTVMRIQRSLKTGYTQVARVDLAARNIDPDRVSFDIKMVVPSGALELAQLEVERLKIDVATAYRGENFSEYFIWSRILRLSDEEIKEIQMQRAREQSTGVSFENSDVIGGPDPELSVDNWIDTESQKVSKKQELIANKIMESMVKNNAEFGSRVKLLRSLVTELKWAVHTNKNRRKNK
jgi:intein/homing endonuclease